MIDFNDINLWKQGNNLEKYNFKNNIKIEQYDLKNKETALNIIRNNDFLQYHYFSQDYNAVKAASYIYLFYLTYNNIKMYIGFASIAAPTLAKKLRRKYFGKQFLELLYAESKEQNGFVKDKTYVMSRIVLLPSYRGLGLSAYLLEYITKDMRNKSFYFEMLSNMFHNYYFAGYEFNTTFINIKKLLTKEEYALYFESSGTTVEKISKNGKSHGPKGYKGDTKYLANIVFDYKENDFFKKILQDKYNVEIDWNIKNEFTREMILWADENEIPLILLKHLDFNYIKENKENILEAENNYIKSKKDILKKINIEEGEDLW